MQQLLNAIIFEENGWQIAQCVEFDVASQGNTVDEAFANLIEALILHFRAPSNTFTLPFSANLSETMKKHPSAVHRILELKIG